MEVFSRVASFPALAALREGLSLFMRHFLLKGLVGEERAALLERVEMAEKALNSRESGMKM